MSKFLHVDRAGDKLTTTRSTAFDRFPGSRGLRTLAGDTMIVIGSTALMPAIN